MASLTTSSGAKAERPLLLGGASLLLVALTLPALSSGFFAENFQYLGQRAAAGSYWRALLSPTDSIFYRPLLFSFSLPWYHLLPPDPVAYHLRNLLFTLVNLGLFHALLCRLVAEPRARIVALLIFAASKVHLTTIGYLNIFDSIVMSMLLLAALLALDGYLRRGTVGLGIAAALLLIACILTKDFGLVALPVALLLPWVQNRRGDAGLEPPAASAARRLRVRSVFLPATMALVAYLALRFAIVPTSLGDNEVYAPRLSLQAVALKARLLGSALANTSLLGQGVTGAPGVVGAIAARDGEPGTILVAEALATLAIVAGLVLVAAWARKPAVLLFPLLWAAAYFGPTLLTRNLQIYYAYEAVIAVALLFGLALDRAPPRAYAVAWAVLAFFVVNAAVSNYRSSYSWQYVADHATAAHGLVARELTPEVDRITFVSARPELWAFALGTAGTPMLQELLDHPRLEVSYARSDQLPPLDTRRHLVLDLERMTRVSGRPSQPLRIVELFPAEAEVGQAFNRQPNGLSAIGLAVEGATPSTRVLMGGRELDTTFGDEHLVTAFVPADLLRQPASHVVQIRDGDQLSNQLHFTVTSPATTSNRRTP